MTKENFMRAEEHFDVLVNRMKPALRSQYDLTRHVRAVDCFRGRTFQIYEIEDREPVVLDHLSIQDFHCNERVGASTEIRGSNGKTMTVGYEPVKLFGYPVFVFLPLHLKMRWSTTPSQPENGSLAFQMCIRTQSRLHLRERGVVYMETGVDYAREFDGIQV
jgi:hypothetical protein